MSRLSIYFEVTPSRPGLTVHDPIEGRRLEIGTDRVPDPTDISTDEVSFPVDLVKRIETEELRLDRMDHVVVRPAGESDNELVPAAETRSFGAGTHQIEISAPIKLYLAVEGPFTIETGLDYIDVDLEKRSTVTIGARSYHERPAGTITVGEDPEDVMTAISAFGSALKSTTPDVSFPTLRGHPPLIETGTELDIPEGLSMPESGITIEVPRSRRMFYPTASLAFYLGARVEPGPIPRIRTTTGYEYRLDDERWLENAVARVLRQVLLFDAAVRSAGVHGAEVLERDVVEPLLDSDPATLYDLPLRDRLEAYLAVPWDAVEGVGPRWAMTAYVPPTAAGAELLPFVANELGIVRNPRGTRIEDREARSSLGVPDERSRRYVSAGERERLLVRPEFFDDSVEHVWLGDHVPVGATKGTIEAFESDLERTESTGPVEVALVSNHWAASADRSILEDAYSVREDLQFDLRTFVDTDATTLRSILTAGFDIVHFVGRTVPGGLVTADGTLSLADLDGVDVGVIVLEADHSFEEALWMAEHGARSGLGTVGTIAQERPMEMGRMIARLLSMGFPLRGALEIAREESKRGEQYLLVGNGNVDVMQPEGNMPALIRLERAGDQVISTPETYPSGSFRVGSTVNPHFAAADPFIGPGNGGQQIATSVEALLAVLERSTVPVRYDGDLLWTASDLEATVRDR